MIINHNIAALNTYRQLSSNTSVGQKSLERLSSGLRINRAGDDAAGLAISEKMRAQIRGLDQATRNAQDGISMIQTAEGALNETHSILQRMRELANQAANDTNVEIDRDEIQKEMNQLTSEINRVGNTTEFNTQKVLDGGRQITTNATASAARLSGGYVAADANATASGVGGTDAVAATWVSGNFVTTADLADGDTITFGTTTITIDVAAADATHVAGNATLAAGYTNNTATLNFVTADGSLQDDDVIRDGILEALNAMKYVAGSPIADITFTASGVSGITATDTLVNGATNNAWLFAETSANASFANADSAAQHAAVGGATGVAGVAATAIITFDDVAEEGSSVVMADKKISFWDSGSGNFSNATEAKSVLEADFIVDIAGLSDKDDMGAAVLAAVGASGIGGWTMSVGAGASVTDKVTLTSNTLGVFQGHNRVQELDVTGSAAATGEIAFSDEPAEGSYITIGDQKIGFYDSSLGNYATDAAAINGMSVNFAVDVKGLTSEQIVDKLLDLQSGINTELDKDVNLAKSVEDDGSVKLVISAQTAGFGGNTIATSISENTTDGFKATFQIGANQGQSFQIEIDDMRSQALSVSGNTAAAEHATVDGAKYTAVANVTNGTDNENVDYALDVSTHQAASAAVKVINNAIETVSAERSKLGAYQNRLEHTINNLGTSSENLTAAESRIRDVDMAKEMMEFTKNNILSQAAQAMLAQANQQPQGVLQLLR